MKSYKVTSHYDVGLKWSRLYDVIYYVVTNYDAKDVESVLTDSEYVVNNFCRSVRL